MQIRSLALGLAGSVTLALAPASLQAQAARPDSLALARQYTEWLYTGMGDSLLAHTAPSSREGIPSADWWMERTNLIGTRGGLETEVISEDFRMRNGRPQYWRVARFSDMQEPLLLRWVIDDNGMIAGIGMGPLSQAPPTDD